MDPFTALGMAAAVVHFTDFGTRFSRNIANMHKPNAELEGDLFFKQSAVEFEQVVVLLREKAQQETGGHGDIADPNQKVSLNVSGHC